GISCIRAGRRGAPTPVGGIPLGKGHAMVSSSKICLGVLGLAAVVIGTGGCDAGRRDGAIETRTAAVDGQFTIDLTGPIGQRWQKLGGAAVMGDATSAVVSMSQVPAQYQTFANFVIVYSPDVGAV